jgi:hypothetical protein
MALARTRMVAARYPFCILADSREGRSKEADLRKRALPDTPVHGDVRQGLSTNAPRTLCFSKLHHFGDEVLKVFGM